MCTATGSKIVIIAAGNGRGHPMGVICFARIAGAERRKPIALRNEGSGLTVPAAHIFLGGKVANSTFKTLVADVKTKRKELARIEESLANPVESGAEWDKRRKELEREASIARDAIRQSINTWAAK